MLLAGPALLLAACATQTANTAAVPPISLPVVAETAAALVESGNFTADQLYRAIIGELSAQRGELERAAEAYFELAMETRDAGIVARAVQFASATGDRRRLLELSPLWSEAAPEQPEPHVLLAFQLLETGRPSEALAQMEQVLETGGSFEFSILAAATARLDEAERDDLIARLRSLVERFPGNRSARIALVQLLAQNRAFDAALAEFGQLGQDEQRPPDLIQLEAQLQQSAEHPEQAAAVLQAGLERFPEDRELRLAYARILLQQRELAEARQQFAIMLEQAPGDRETLLSAGLLDLEMEDYPSAIGIFEQMLSMRQDEDESHFYLGYANEQLGELETAIGHFRQVRQGVENFLPAQQQATVLAVQLGRFNEAHDWLMQLSRGSSRMEIRFISMEASILLQQGHATRALELLDRSLKRYPNHVELLFAQVLAHDAIGDMASAEADLQQIIRLQPENARALNHLGYMLADRSERYEEALALIERAIAVEPDDPAIIDSLGWAQYKLGMLDEALANLQRAYAAFPDDEVAAHLGEVLWMLGRRDEAEQIWAEALARDPASEHVLPTMERLKGRP